MAIELPQPIDEYVDASNRHDVPAILSCFADDATVQDEGGTLRGKAAIQGWIEKTIEQYKFQFKPLYAEVGDAEVVVSVEVSGTFDGSPVTLDYRFGVENNKITSLSID